MKKRISLLMILALCIGLAPTGGFAEATQSNEAVNSYAAPVPQAVVQNESTQVTSNAAVSVVFDSDVDFTNIQTENFEVKGSILNHVATSREITVNVNTDVFKYPIDAQGRFKFEVKFKTGYNKLSIDYNPNDLNVTGCSTTREAIEYNMIDGGVFNRKLSYDKFDIQNEVKLEWSDALKAKMNPGSTIKLFSYNSSNNYIQGKWLVTQYEVDKATIEGNFTTGLLANVYPFKNMEYAYVELYDKANVLLATGRVKYINTALEYPEGEPYFIALKSFSDYSHAKIKIESGDWIDVSDYFYNGILKLPYSLFPDGLSQYEVEFSDDEGNTGWPESWTLNKDKNTTTTPLTVSFDSSTDLEALSCENTVLKGSIIPFNKEVTNALFIVNDIRYGVTLTNNGHFEVPLKFKKGYNALSIRYNNQMMTTPVYAEVDWGGAWSPEMNSDKTEMIDNVSLRLFDRVANDEIKPGMRLVAYKHTIAVDSNFVMINMICDIPVEPNTEYIPVNIRRSDIHANNPYEGYTFDLRDNSGKLVNSFRLDTPAAALGEPGNEEVTTVLIPFAPCSEVSIKINNGEAVDLSSQVHNGVLRIADSKLMLSGLNQIECSVKFKNKVYSERLLAYANGFYVDDKCKVNVLETRVKSDQSGKTRLSIKGKIDFFTPEHREVQILIGKQISQILLDEKGYFEIEKDIEPGFFIVRVNYGYDLQPYEVWNAAHIVVTKNDNKQNVIELNTPLYLFEQILMKVGNGAEKDVTDCYKDGVLSLKKELLATGDNSVLFTLKSGIDIYQYTLNIQKENTATGGGTTGGTTSGGTTGGTTPGGNTGGGSTSTGGGGYSGGGGFSGGGAFVAPSVGPVQVPTPTSTEVPKLVGVKVETVNGKQVAKATLNKDLVQEALKSAPAGGKSPVVVVAIDSKTDKAIGEIDSKNLTQLIDKKATIQLKTNEASFSLPSSEINTTLIAQKLSEGGKMVMPESVELRIEAERAPAHAVQVLDTLKKDGKVTVLSEPMTFTVMGISGEKAVEIKDFSKFVERRMLLNGTVLLGEVVTAVVIEKDGALRAVPTKIVDENGKKYAVINSYTNSDYAVIKTTANFKDIQSHWAKPYVETVGSKMIMSGVNQQFSPDKNITRGDLAVALVKALGLGKTEQITLSDLTNDQRSGFIQTAVKYGLVTGYKDNTFKPNQTVSREEAMCMVLQAAKLAGIDVSALKAEASYKDNAKISLWAKKAVDQCTELGFIKGSEGNFRSKDNLTNAEISVILVKLLEKANLI